MGQLGFYIGSVIGGFLWTFAISLLVGLFAFKDDFDPDHNARYSCGIGLLGCLAFSFLGNGVLGTILMSPFYFAGAVIAYPPRRFMYRRRAKTTDVDTDAFS